MIPFAALLPETQPEGASPKHPSKTPRAEAYLPRFQRKPWSPGNPLLHHKHRANANLMMTGYFCPGRHCSGQEGQ